MWMEFERGTSLLPKMSEKCQYFFLFFRMMTLGYQIVLKADPPLPTLGTAYEDAFRRTCGRPQCCVLCDRLSAGAKGFELAVFRRSLPN